MSVDDSVLASVSDPEGRDVVLLARIWIEKVTRARPELAEHLEEVLQTVSAPGHLEPDPRDARLRYYRRELGPSRWLLVVVSYEQEPARIITALGTRKDPRRLRS